ncbi:hypothetical protein HMPREF9499_00176 [Enterococcus faecalis TX0012]|nr:hypothetical protein HMPREF9499_00176 [Enterococcus faecalis TX0012]
MENFGLFPKELVLSRRLSGFEREAKIQSDFCPTLLFLREIIKKGRFLFSFTL